MFQFELHPHIGEIRTDILVYEKGGVIKHIKAPPRVKVGINQVSKNRMVTFRKAVNYRHKSFSVFSTGTRPPAQDVYKKSWVFF